MSDDELVARTPSWCRRGLDADAASAAARLFDVRRVIGGLFIVYGLILTVRGPVRLVRRPGQGRGGADQPVAGPGSLRLLGLLFLAWQWWRPIEVAPARDTGDETGPQVHH